MYAARPVKQMLLSTRHSTIYDIDIAVVVYIIYRHWNRCRWKNIQLLRWKEKWLENTKSEACQVYERRHLSRWMPCLFHWVCNSNYIALLVIANIDAGLARWDMGWLCLSTEGCVYLSRWPAPSVDNSALCTYLGQGLNSSGERKINSSSWTHCTLP
jgi:hypothetical protein